jgi:putative phosphoribosyl transferase
MMALSVQTERITIQADKTEMEGMLSLPEDSIGMILFATSGGDTSSRVSQPNDYVASVLREARLGTLRIELLSRTETGDRRGHADVALLAERLRHTCDWLRTRDATADLPIGLYGAGSYVAAALQLASASARGISAIVSRGGSPELASQAMLSKVGVPTLLIVGGLDDGAVRMHRAAYATLRCKKRLEVIPGATNAFEEPGNLEVIARLARGWFLQHAHSRSVY